MTHTTVISFPQGQPSSRTFGERWAYRIGRMITHQKRYRAVLQDEFTYPDPRTYNPERYLKEGKLDSLVKDPEETIFGFGRRC